MIEKPPLQIFTGLQRRFLLISDIF